MKVSREKAAENRETLVTAASRLFREQGIDGVGVADISKAAGLTHGALYAQFDSKQALAAQALAPTTTICLTRAARQVPVAQHALRQVITMAACSVVRLTPQFQPSAMLLAARLRQWVQP